jgi:hypothetical protein
MRSTIREFGMRRGGSYAALRRSVVFTALCVGLLLSACAGPGPGLTGNDTGGIIPWSPANRVLAVEWAQAHCARYGKIARITSVQAQYGGYIGFACRFDRRRVG